MKTYLFACAFAFTSLLAGSASAVTINVNSSTGLVNAFATAETNWFDFHKIVLPPGTYKPASTLTLTRGSVSPLRR